MKKFVVFLFIPLIFGFSPPKYNEKSIISHFEEILNEYRTTKGLCKISIDESIKEFTDERCSDIIRDYSHNGFKEKVITRSFKFTFAGENITTILNIPPNNKPYYSSNIKEIGDIMNKMAIGQSTNYDVAMYCFLKWKYSPSHNELLLSPETKRFYLSYDKSRTSYYFCFVALD